MKIMEEEVNLEKPIKEVIDKHFSCPEIKEFYYSLMDKLKETYNLKSMKDIIPKHVLCAEMILEHTIKNRLYWERIGASEIYEFNKMLIYLDIQNPGYDPRLIE